MRVYWLFVPFLVVLSSLLVLYPNFSSREIELAIQTDFYSLNEAEKSLILSKFIDRWEKDYNKDASLTITPDPKKGLQNIPYFIIQGRFITSAKINQISQENPRLVREEKNKFRLIWLEEFFGMKKPLSIKLGLDLQGGMRVVLKGDFENYSEKLRDIYSNEINDLEKIISDKTKSEKDRKDAETRLKDIEFNFDLSHSRKLQELQKAKLIIDNRLASQNLTEPQVRIRKEQYAIEVSLPGVTNSAHILEIIQNTETVEYRLEEADGVNSFATKIQQNDAKLVQEGKREETSIFQYQKIVKEKQGKKVEDAFLASLESKYLIPKDRYKLYAIWARGKNKKSVLLPREFVVLERAIALSGDDFKNARPSFSEDSYGHTVNFSLTPSGADKFFNITSLNKGRKLAIIWGGKVISNPTINNPIAGGNAEISGNFTQEEATDLANIISEGALPIPLQILEMRFIGPTLGLDSIKVGFQSVIVGFLLVMAFMLSYYRLSGIIANIALLANVIILSALLTLMDFTLTLPGFAGVILTVGMAVDANVIIYERIKEELLSGKTILQSVNLGFENAFWTIVDSNVTTLISGILMIKLGSGPIKGFAITLCWGIITSLFTSLFLSRLLMVLLVEKFGIRSLQIGFKKIGGKNV